MADTELLATALLGRLGPLSMQAALLVLFALTLSLLGRRVPAQLRYLLWLVVVLRLALPAPISTPLGLLGRGPVEVAPSLPSMASTPSLAPAADSAREGPSKAALPAAPPRPAGDSATLSIRAAIAALWGAGVIAFVVFVGARLSKARRLLAAAYPAHGALAAEVRELSRRLGVRPPAVRLPRLDSTLPAPALFGLRRPTLVLPEAMARDWTPAEREPLIVHELAHLRRRDLWINGLQLAVQALYFFHPLVWLANRRLRVERELACDEEVARFYGKRSNLYAKALLRVARGEERQPRTAVAVALASPRSLLGERVRRLLAGSWERRVPKATSAAALLASLTLVALASARPTQLEQPALPVAGGSDLVRLARELDHDPERRAAVEAEWLEQVRTGLGDPVQLQQALTRVRWPRDRMLDSMMRALVGDRKQRRAWLDRLVLLPDDPATLRAAAAFFTLEHSASAERLLLTGWELQPEEPYWPLELARLERLRGLGAADGGARAARRALTLYQVALTRLDDRRAYHALGDVARTAFDAGEVDRARRYAHLLLESANTQPQDWNYGNALHAGHTTLGLAALAGGDHAEAARQLRLSAETPGSPQLNSFGPSMRLAADLLAVGERQAVLDYLERCGEFWSSHEHELVAWSTDIRGGRTPAFGNLYR